MPSETTDVLFERYGPRYRWFVTVTVLIGTVSAMVTTTIVNVAIPDIMGAFGIGQDRAQWFMTGALSAMTVGMLLNAWLIRNFGQRRTFIGALSAFVISLFVAGAAPNETVLVFCRVVQGCVAGILQHYLHGFGKRGMQLALEVEDRPGSIKDVTDVIRSYGGRLVSILTSYEKAAPGHRRLYVRAWAVEREKLPQMEADLRSKASLLYVVDHKEGTRREFIQSNQAA